MSLLDQIVAPAAQLMQPPRGLEFDYAKPVGEPALMSPDSISWRIFKNPVTLFIGGVAAVLLELAEPSVRSGVWDHSSFRTDPVTRLRRTGAAAMMTVYGPRNAAEAMIARVVRMHGKVAGTTPGGIPYYANDPRLLDWVQATASFGFIEAYSRYAHRLTHQEKSLAFAEVAPAAHLYGALNAPASVGDWQRILDEFMPHLEPSPTAFEFIEIMRTTRILPGAGPMQRVLIAAAVDLLPPAARERLELHDHGLSWGAGPIIAAIAKLADKMPIRSAPPAQASIRLGRPATFLYSRRT